MSDTDKPAAAKPAVVPARRGSALGMLALLLAVGLGVAGYYWTRFVAEPGSAALNARVASLAGERDALLRRLSDSEQRLQKLETGQSAIGTDIDTLRQTASGIEQRVKSLAAHGGEQKLDWVLAESEYLILAASQRIALEHDAATAHAALWCGLTPLLCDIDPETWLPDENAEDELLDRYGDDIAVILPNATFGNCLDLTRYNRLSAAHGIPLVVDAAASLGSLDAYGVSFGMGSPHPLVFSMHATKTFATAEAGLIYSADQQLIASLRVMGNFGFGQPRSATMPGLNTKLSEVSALLGLTKLRELELVANHRHGLYELYCNLLPEFTFQRMTGHRIAHQFVSVLVPEALANRVTEVAAELARQGIGSGRYFVPHLAEQPFFQQSCVAGELPVTDAISRRVIALPMSDFLTTDEVGHVCDVFREICCPPRTRRFGKQ